MQCLLSVVNMFIMFVMGSTDIILHLNHSLVQLTPSKLLTQLQEYSYG